MAQASVRAVAACAIRPAPLPTALSVRSLVCGGTPCSLRERTRALMFPTVGLNIIRVGVEFFDDDVESEIDSAIAMTRLIYAAVGFGIGPIRDYQIPFGDTNGHAFIDSDDEATALTDEWTVPGSGIDVFMVLSFPGTAVAGVSPIGGPCDKNAPSLTGSTVATNFPPVVTGLALAHEIGHYLGLPHCDDETNLMFRNVPNGGLLTAGQAEDIRRHCFTRLECR